MSEFGRSQARDAALRRVASARRWLIAGAIGLTGVFSAVASQAFPGRSLKATTTTTGAAAPQTSAPVPPVDNSLPSDDSQAQVPQQSSPDTSIPPPQSIPQPSDSSGGAVSGGS
jgi:cytoskeletal protein RodZ